MSTARYLLALVDRFLPVSSSADDLALLRGRLVVAAPFILSLLASVYVVWFALGFQLYRSALVVALFIAAFLVVPPLVRLTQSVRLGADCFLLSVWGIVTYLTVVNGGTYGSAPAFVVVPVIAVGTHGVRGALGWAVFCVATVAALALVHFAGVELPQEMGDEGLRYFTLAAVCSAAAATTATAILHRVLAEAALNTAEEARGRVAAVLATVPDGLLTLDDEGMVQSMNPAARALFSVTNDVKPPLRSLLVSTPPLDVGALAGVPVEATGVPLMGKAFAAEVRAARIGKADPGEYVVSVRDVTLRKETEHALADARDRALQATRAKSVFLANMSHELRTPLNAIIGYSEMLMEEADDAASSQVRDLGRVRDAGRHLLSVIDDVLDLSKIEAGRLELHPVEIELQELIVEVTAVVEPIAARQGNTLTVENKGAPKRVYADPVRIKQILYNLLSNASKFTQQGQIVLRSSRHIDGAKGALVFEVEDTGRGIPDEQLQRVFAPFVQVDDTTTRRESGTGLGLTITRHLCQLMGGDVFVQSKAGVGSTFTVRLPMVGIALMRPDSSASLPPPRFDGASVLVIVDDPTARGQLRRQLQRTGFQVVTATGTNEALEVARRVRPQAITLDLLMPGLGGWQVLAALKADAALSRVPLLVMSMVEDHATGFVLGPAQVVRRPIVSDELVSVLGRYRLQRRDLLLAIGAEVERSIEALEADGWRVTRAATRREGRDRLLRERPSALLIDVGSPGADGFALLAELRKDIATSTVPVVLIAPADTAGPERAELEAQVARVMRTTDPLERLMAGI